LNNLPFTLIELGLLACLMAACLANVRQHKAMLLLLPFAIACAAGAAVGYPKSAYHLLLIGVIWAASLRTHWSKTSRRLVKAGAISSLLVVFVISVALSDWQLEMKITAPQLFSVWALILLLTSDRSFRIPVAITIIFDMMISLQVAARGVLLGDLFALLSVRRNPRIIRRFIPLFAVLSTLLYILVYPIFVLMGSDDFLSGSLSNFQRSLLNFQAVIDIVGVPFTLNETGIFAAASELQYSHDSDSLTVHNLLLAFGLFNGLIPALWLGYLILRILRQLALGPYLPIGLYLYFVMLLGPDSSVTRYSLILLTSLLVISGGIPTRASVSTSGRALRAPTPLASAHNEGHL